MRFGDEQARTGLVEAEQGEVVFGRGGPVRYDDQSRQLDEEGLGPPSLRPAGEQRLSAGALRDEAEQLAAGGIPRLVAEKMLVPVVVGGESRRRRRYTVMGADDGG